MIHWGGEGMTWTYFTSRSSTIMVGSTKWKAVAIHSIQWKVLKNCGLKKKNSQWPELWAIYFIVSCKSDRELAWCMAYHRYCPSEGISGLFWIAWDLVWCWSTRGKRLGRKWEWDNEMEKGLWSYCLTLMSTRYHHVGNFIRWTVWPSEVSQSIYAQ